MTVRLADANETEKLGAELGSSLAVNDWVALIGPLGAGKTTLVRGFLKSLGWHGVVRSPSFNLIHRYETSPPVVHADYYRIGEANAADLTEEFEGAVGFVEWPPDRLVAELGTPKLTVTIAINDDGSRSASVTERP